MWRNAYLLVLLGRGARGDDFCGGGVVNGGLWWPEWASKVAGDCVAAAVGTSVASPEWTDEQLELRGNSRW